MPPRPLGFFVSRNAIRNEEEAMSRWVTSAARSYTSGTPRRCICSARNQHFVMDDADYSGGPNEALIAAEAFLTGITGCAVLMTERVALDRNIPLDYLDVSIEAGRDMDSRPSEHSVYDRIHMRFELTGPNEAQAEELVGVYKRR